MKWFIFFFIFFLAFILETTLTTLPLVLIACLCFAVLHETGWIFFIACFAGILLDALSLRFLGSSSIFFIIFLGLVFLYERKFEIRTIPFTAIAAFIGSFAFLKIFGYQRSIQEAFVGSLTAVLLFLLMQKLTSVSNNL